MPDTFEANLGGIELSCAAGIVVTDYDLRGDVEWRDGKIVLAEIWLRTFQVQPDGLLGPARMIVGPWQEDRLAQGICTALREWAATDEGQENLRGLWERADEARRVEEAA